MYKYIHMHTMNALATSSEQGMFALRGLDLKSASLRHVVSGHCGSWYSKLVWTHLPARVSFECTVAQAQQESLILNVHVKCNKLNLVHNTITI